ncbi:MAG: SpoIIE family protein phosphatase [Chloroflexi bacterium]|nr:SpoIIE family protein phosphatase [Chloroflexota bacterium]MBU1751851.1 SpoIIE family protein phosphatase [Chloroflexota bacterium]MBU1879875.1 SpoIIE family protein phosphatase [Chloroflexota bacterium]
MSKRSDLIITNLFHIGLIALTGLVALYSFVLAAHWRQEPFPGFFTEPNLVVSSLGEQISSATGLHHPDRILAVNGVPVRTPADIQAQLRPLAHGQLVSYTVQCEDGLINVSSPVTQLSLEDFSVIFLLPYLLGLLYLAVGGVIYALRMDARPNRAFLLVCVAISLCLMLLFNTITGHELVRLWLLALPLAGAALLHLALVFPRSWRLVQRVPALIWLPFVPALLVALAAEWYLTDPLRYADFWRLSYLLVGLFALGWLFMMVLSLVLASSRTERQPIAIVLGGGALAFGPITLWALLAGSGVTLGVGAELPALCMTFFPLAVGYAVIRHGLFDIDVLVRRSVSYFTLTVIFLGLYFIFVTVLQRLFQLVLGETTDLSVIISTLIIAVLFMPLRNRLQTLIDRTFYRERYDYQQSLLRFAESTRTIIDLTELLRQLVTEVRQTMHVVHGAVFLTIDDHTIVLAEAQEQDLAPDPQLSLSPELAQALLEGRPLDVDPAGPFADWSMNLLVPLIYQDQLAGILGLGPKLSGAPYTVADRDLLTTLADQVASAITIAQLVRENEGKRRMEQELAIARDIQQAFFPQQVPTMPALDIAALCRPARETGGDLYDFIPLRGRRLGVIIGDVSGKSIPAALIMAVSLGVTRAEIAAHERPGLVLSQANHWLCRDMLPGHFVSLLYVIIDAPACQLTLGNAGHLWPVLLRGHTAQYIKPTPAFPLGIVADAQYRQDSVALQPGDRLLLYTDGVVEAMNSQLELFGFDRLLDVCQQASAHTSAQAILDVVLDAVQRFVGAAEPTDDLTMIVLALAANPEAL